MRLSAADITRLNRLLDQALEMPPADRAAWLSTLQEADATLRPKLQQLLADAESPTFAAFLRTMPQLDRGDDSISDRTAGDQVGPYRLIRVLGHGGMGTVWLAERADGTLKRNVALKLPLIAGHPQMREHLLRERDVLAALEHPNIARLYDAGIAADGQPYLALEMVEGQPIDAYCRSAGLDVDARLRVFLQVARAVAYAHARLTLHRDLKPSNILVTPGGEVRLLDFGVAKLMDAEGAHASEPTQLGRRALTPDYASPEQILGQTLTVASDVYSLGVVLYELLAGVRPYKLRRDSPGALEDAIVATDPRPPSAVITERAARKRLAGDLDTIVLKALKKAPGERYATAAALVDDIERHLAGRPVLALPDSTWYRARKFIARNRLGVAAAGAVVASLALGLGAALWQASMAKQQARSALEASRKSEAVQRALLETFSKIVSDRNELSPATSQFMNRVLESQRDEANKLYRDDPQLRAQVLGVIGTLWDALDQSRQALGALGDAVEALRAAAAPAHEIAAVLVHMGTVARNAGADADRYFKDALAQVGAADRGAALLVRAQAVQEYVDWLIESERVEEAERLLANAEHDMPALPRDGTESAMLEFERGRVYVKRGQITAAIEKMEHAERLLASAPDRNRMALVRVYGMLGAEYRDNDDAAGAERVARDAVALNRAIYGNDRLIVAESLLGLAEAIAEQGRYADAIGVLDEACDVAHRSSTSAAKVDFVARCFVDQGRTRIAYGDIAAAGPFAAQLQERIEAGGSDLYPGTRRNALAVLARYWMEIGDYDGAKKLLRERARLSSGMIAIASNFALVRVAAAQGALREAQQLLGDSEHKLPPQPASVLRQLDVTAAAATAHARGDHAHVVAVLEPYLARPDVANRRTALSPHDELDLRLWLARALIGESRLDAAAEQLSKAQGLADEQHAASPRRAAYLAVQGLLRAAQGRTTDAATALEQAQAAQGALRDVPHQRAWTKDLQQALATRGTPGAPPAR